jgi:hypothetical protein
MKTSAIWALALLVTACGGGSDSPVLLKQTMSGTLDQIAIGQTRTVDQSNVTVKLVNVTDSRCPTAVTCIRAGEALVDLDVAQGSEHQSLSLATESTFFPSTGTAMGWEFTVKAVSPYPVNGPAAPEAFRVDLTYRQL